MSIAERRRATSNSLWTRPVSADSVALVPACAEPDAGWLPTDEDRWDAYLTDDEPAEIAFYCPRCAERAFGGS